MTQKIQKFKNVTTKQNNLGLFILLTVFSLFGIMSLHNGQTSAQSTCTPSTTVTEGNLFPGGVASFGVSSGAGSVTVDHINAGTGLRSLTVTIPDPNTTVNIPAFAPGTLAPVTVTFTRTNTALPVDFTLRAASTFHAINIRVRCAVIPDPTPTPTPTPTGCTRTQGFFKNHADDWAVTSLTLGTVNYNQSQLLSILNQPVRGNGLVSLSHQLIAAKLNVAAGASVPANVAAAITAADALIGGRMVPPVGTGFLSPDSTSALTAVLDEYNNGNSPGGPPHCDD